MDRRTGRISRSFVNFFHLAMVLMIVGVILSISLPARAEQPVDLELVLAIDVSGSVDAQEYDLQVTGLALAFEDPEILAAINRAGTQGIAVAVVQWSSSDEQWLALDWDHLQDAAGLAEFSRSLKSMPRKFIAGDTVLSRAMKFSAGLFADNGFVSRRQVIDVSGDGGAEIRGHTGSARDSIVSAGFVINGLAIETDDDSLSDFYRRKVIGGPQAFVISVADYSGFGSAIRRKLAREIAPLWVSMRPAESGSEGLE